MPKSRQQKIEILKDLEDKLEKNRASLLVDYKGLKVEEIGELRDLLRGKGISFNVTKVSLLKLALSDRGIEVDPRLLDRPLAIAFAEKDEVEICKEVTFFAKEHQALEILGGIVDKGFITPAVVSRLSQLPSRDELLAQVVGSVAAPIHGLFNVLAGNIRGLINVLAQYQSSR